MRGVRGSGRFRWWMIALALTFPASPLWAGSRGVDLLDELHAAHVITRARILSYEEEGLSVQPLPEPAQPLLVHYASGGPPALIRDDWQERTDAEVIYTGNWPPVGAEVLVIVGTVFGVQDAVSLFAWPRGEEYRFWSPHMTGSVAFFECRPPARPVEPLRFEGDPPDIRTSWDGCFLPISFVVELDTLRKGAEPIKPPMAGTTEQPKAAMKHQPRFGFRMDRETFQDLRGLAPELAGAHWPGLTVDGQQAWDTGNLTAVYNTGYYLEDDLNDDGQTEAALLLNVPQPGGVERQYLLVATRRIPGVPWTRIGLVALPSAPGEWSIVDAIEQQTNDPRLAAFFKTTRPPSAVQESDVFPAADSATTRPIAEWIARLTDTDPRVRLEAAEALGRLGPEAAVAIEPLVQRFYDPEELVRDAAGSSLEQIGPVSVPALRQLVMREGSTHGRHDPGARSQRSAVALLGRLIPVTDEAVSLAADVCRDRAIHDVVRHDACWSLAALGAREPRVRQGSIEMLLRVFQESDADPSLRTDLIQALGRLGPEPPVVTTLAQALHDREFFIRRAAAGTLAQFGAAARSALPELRTALSDSDPEVKALAQRAIEQMATGNSTVSEGR